MYHENHETKHFGVDGAYPIVRGGKAVIRALGFVFFLTHLWWNLVDTPDLGSGAVRLEGSSPSGCTNTVFQGGCRLRNILPKMVGKERTAEYWIRLLVRVSSV